MAGLGVIFRDIIYLVFLFLMVGLLYVAHLGVQRQAYVAYVPLLSESLSRSQKSLQDLGAFPEVKNLHDQIFLRRQRELQIKMVKALLQINTNLHFGGELKSILEKLMVAPLLESDLFLLRDLQDKIRLLPKLSWKFPRQLFYFSATSLVVSYDELKGLEQLKVAFMQKTIPLEGLLRAPRLPTSGSPTR